MIQILWGDSVMWREKEFLVTDTDPEARPLGRDIKITGSKESYWVKSDELKILEDCEFNLCNGSGHFTDEDGYKRECLCKQEQD